MSVMGFQNKQVWIDGWVGGVSPIQLFFGFFLNFAKPLMKNSMVFIWGSCIFHGDKGNYDLMKMLTQVLSYDNLWS